MVLRRDRNDEVVHVIVDGGGDVYTVDVEKECGREPADSLVPINQGVDFTTGCRRAAAGSLPSLAKSLQSVSVHRHDPRRCIGYAVTALTAVTRSLSVRTSKTALHQTPNWLISESLSSQSARGSGLSQNTRLARVASVAKWSKPAAR